MCSVTSLEAEGTLTVLILWLCSFQSLTPLIPSLAGKGCSSAWLLGWEVGMFAAALQLGAWGAPGHAASQFLLAAVL